MKITHIEDVSKLRKAAYPPITELADALYWQGKGDNSKMESYLKKCEEVKLKFPKLVNEE